MSGVLSLKINKTVHKHCTLVDKVVSPWDYWLIIQVLLDISIQIEHLRWVVGASFSTVGIRG